MALAPLYKPGMKVRLDRATLELMEGDIADLDVDAIVNPANSALVLGGGVAGAIARRGGPSIQAECDAMGGTPVGTAVITGGGRLAARHVIHAVGPRWGEPDAEQKLAEATRSILLLADSRGLKSVGLPALSTGIFGYPIDEAARVILRSIRDYVQTHAGSVERVIVCLFGHPALSTFETELRRQVQGEGA